MISINALKAKMQCSKKFDFYQQGLRTEREGFYVALNKLLDCLGSFVMNPDKRNLIDEILSTMDLSWFDTYQEKLQVEDYWKKIFYRFLSYTDAYWRYENIETKVYLSPFIIIQGVTYQIKHFSVDFVLIDQDTVEAVLIKRSKPKLSSRARKPENRPENDLEVLLIFQELKKRYPEHQIRVSLYYLVNKDDKKYKVTEIFKNNIVTVLLKEGQELALNDFPLQPSPKKEDCQFCEYNILCQSEINNSNKKNIIPSTDTKIARPKLTEKQKEVVEHSYGPVRVLACPGSGKTACLVERYTRLVEKGIDPQKILLLTFTNKAVEEIITRVKRSLLSLKSEGLSIYTYNAFSYELIRKHSKLLGYDSITLANDVKINQLFAKMIDFYPIPDISFSQLFHPTYGKMKDIIESYKIYQKDKDRFFVLNAKFNEEQNQVLSIGFHWVEKQLRKDGLITFDDQIKLVNQLFAENERVLEYYQRYYEFIMVDEYQDTDEQQAQMIYYLSDLHKNIMVVGDEDQILYSWRGANRGNMKDFKERFNSRDIVLDLNFRSTPQIVETAANLISKNEYRFNKKMISSRKEGADVEIIDEEAFEAKLQQLLLKDPDNIAIIGRKNDDLSKVYEKYHMKFRLQQPRLLRLEPTFILILDILRYVLISKLDSIAKYNITKLYGGDFESLDSQLKFLLFRDIDDFLEEIIDLFKLQDKSVIKEINKIVEEEKILNLEDLYERLNLMVTFYDGRTIEPDYSGVKLLTAHSAKGKEYKAVIILCRNFSYSKNMSEDEIEEERRSFYVALTRAQDELILCDSSRKKGYVYFIDDIQN